MFSFRNVSLAATVLTGVLFVILLLAPDLIFWIFSIEGNEAARLLSRRAAMLFLGLAIITYSGRNAQHSVLRQAICLGMAVCMFGLAMTGIFEFARGFAGVGIMLAFAAEVGFGIAFIRIWLSNRSQ